MNTAALATRGFGIKQLLVVDALTCVVTGALLVSAAGFLTTLLGLPEALLRYAGLVLFPCAALMFVASRTLNRFLVWTVIIGNFAWVAASLVVALAFDPTALGIAFILAQALVVALLGVLEWRAR